MAKSKSTSLVAAKMPIGKEGSVPEAAVEKVERNRVQTLKLSDAEYKRLKQFALDHDRTNQKILLDALAEYLDNHKG